MAEFFLSRSVGFHLVQSYLPTILIVVISWVSFWMDVNSVPGRTTLGVTTLLAVSSQSSGEQRTRPFLKKITVSLCKFENHLVTLFWHNKNGGRSRGDVIERSSVSSACFRNPKWSTPGQLRQGHRRLDGNMYRSENTQIKLSSKT